ncbi:MAG: hypothetical protein J5865_07315 [Lachnospiraceae bacterium]|nr:hypothetical protein [Lachnospiraceae bacterium]
MKLETFIEVETRAARKKAREEGLAEGLKEGESRFAALVRIMMKDLREEDLLQAASDPEYRQKLYKEYGIL